MLWARNSSHMNETLVRPCSLDMVNLSAFSIIGGLFSLTKSCFMFLLIRISIPDSVVPHSSGSGSEKRVLDSCRGNWSRIPQIRYIASHDLTCHSLRLYFCQNVSSAVSDLGLWSDAWPERGVPRPQIWGRSPIHHGPRGTWSEPKKKYIPKVPRPRAWKKKSQTIW